MNIERVQKKFSGEDYSSYRLALQLLNLDSLESLRNKLCLNFTKKAEKHSKFKCWFKLTNFKL